MSITILRPFNKEGDLPPPPAGPMVPSQPTRRSIFRPPQGIVQPFRNSLAHPKVCLSTGLWGRPATLKRLKGISIRHPSKGNQNLRSSARVWHSVKYDLTCPCREAMFYTVLEKSQSMRRQKFLSNRPFEITCKWITAATSYGRGNYFRRLSSPMCSFNLSQMQEIFIEGGSLPIGVF